MKSDYIQSYRDLYVWQKSIGLVTALYEVTQNFPKAELFGLTNQMRRAGISIPSNIGRVVEEILNLTTYVL